MAARIPYRQSEMDGVSWKIDRLQSEIQERDLSTSQQETLYRSNIADREEEITRLKADLNVMYEKVAQILGQLVSREENISRQQLQLAELQEELRRKDTDLHMMGMEVVNVAEQRDQLTDQIDRLQTEIEERDPSTSQQETLYPSDIAYREEEITRLKANLNVMYEKVAQSEGRVGVMEALYRSHIGGREKEITRIKADLNIDRLQTEIEERDLSTSQQETLYRSDIAFREEEITRFKDDLNVMYNKVARLVSREKKINRQQRQLAELQEELRRKDTDLRQMEMEMDILNEEHKQFTYQTLLTRQNHVTQLSANKEQLGWQDQQIQTLMQQVKLLRTNSVPQDAAGGANAMGGEGHNH